MLTDSAGVLSTGVNWAVSTSSTPLRYRLLLSLQIAFAVVVAAGILFLDDSPTFCMTKSRDEDAFCFSPADPPRLYGGRG